MSEIIHGFRFVRKDLTSVNGRIKWVPGEWRKERGTLKLCESGFHACEDPLDSLIYIYGDRWWHCEAKGEILRGDDKFCASEMRLVSEIPISLIEQFAIDCAEHVLPIYEKEHPNDKRPREALETARAYLADPSEENLKKLAAARAAAWTTAWAAARDVAWAAARAAAWTAAWAAAQDAARDAARAAARTTARATAWDAERDWQRKHLKELLEALA